MIEKIKTEVAEQSLGQIRFGEVEVRFAPSHRVIVNLHLLITIQVHLKVL